MIVRLPARCAIEDLAPVLGKAGLLAEEWDSAVLSFEEHASLHASALTFLCAWGRAQRLAGRRLLLRGDASVERELERMGLQEHLGLAQQSHVSDLKPTFVPLRLIATEGDMAPAGHAIHEVVQHHFAHPEASLPAVEWATQEIFDNVLRHAEAREPGAVYAEYSSQTHCLDVSVCDLGRGIKASLGESVFLYSHGHAITTAIQRGVTRSEDIGQGNGLAGVCEIVMRNKGDLRIWSGDMVYRIAGGEEKGFTEIPELPGTGVAFSLDSRRPVNLDDTWIAGRATDYLAREMPEEWATDALALGVADTSLEFGDSEDLARWEAEPINVAAFCSSTGLRGPAQRLREEIEARLDRSLAVPILLDFSTVSSASSSFLDELLGRLVQRLGTYAFRERVKVVGMSERLERMANVVISQRMEGLGAGETPPGSRSED